MFRPDSVSVVVTGDDNAARGMAVALRSAIDTSADKSALRLYVVHEMSAQAIEKIASTCADVDISFVDAAGATQRLPSGEGRFAYLSAVAWLRVFMADLLPQVQRAIYLDTDTLVRRDLAGLYATELGGKPVGAVIDYRPTFTEAGIDRWGEYAFTGKEPYFNSGVLLCDLDAWRAIDVAQKVVDLVGQYGNKDGLMDQDALNVVFLDNWAEVDGRWNNRAFTRLIRTNGAISDIENELSAAAIVHYATPYKPWRTVYPAGIGRDIYLDVESRTAFAGAALEDFDLQGWVGGKYQTPE